MILILGALVSWEDVHDSSGDQNIFMGIFCYMLFYFGDIFSNHFAELNNFALYFYFTDLRFESLVLLSNTMIRCKAA